ncbi:MAG TPA: lipopolysaccharide kinase InaA family protein [Candidatus Hypogeohydataceae bacterium YC41]
MNKETELYTFSEGGTRWTVSKLNGQPLDKILLSKIEALCTDITLATASPNANPSSSGAVENMSWARLVKQNMYRETYLLRPEGIKEGFYLKRYKTRGWKAGVLSKVFSTQAHREWLMMLEMKQKGLPVPLTLALGQKKEGGEVIEYLLTQEIPDCHPVRNCTHLDKEALLKALASLTARLHKSNIFWKDFQLGNILVSTKNRRPELYLVDLHSSRYVTKLSSQQKIWMLAKLLDSFEPFSGDDPFTFDSRDKERFLELYARQMLDFRSEFNKDVVKVKVLADKIKRAHLKSRTYRCLKNSTSFTVEDYDGWKVYRRRDFSTKEIFKLLKAYEDSVQGIAQGKSQAGPQQQVRSGHATMDKGIKTTNKTHLEILESESGKICVKHYWCKGILDYLKDMAGLSRARRAWITGNGLVARGVPTAHPLALVEGPGEAFLLSRALTDFPRLDHYILANYRVTPDKSTAQKKRNFITAIAQAVRQLHDKRIYHGDLKACNILVEEFPQGTWQFYLIDYDRVLFDSEISFRRKAKNLAQLHTSIPWCINRTDRMRFYREYSRGMELDKKAFLHKALQFSTERIPVLMEPIE